MSRDFGKPNRRSLRLQGYDYTRPGSYFITLHTQNDIHLFGNVVDGTMRCNELGEIIHETWRNLPGHYPGVVLDAFVVMPNHLHGVVVLTRDAKIIERPPAVIKYPALGEIVRGLKTFSTRRINELQNTLGLKIWQGRYFERIVRKDELNRIRWYIANNPRHWKSDSH